MITLPELHKFFALKPLDYPKFQKVICDFQIVLHLTFISFFFYFFQKPRACVFSGINVSFNVFNTVHFPSIFIVRDNVISSNNWISEPTGARCSLNFLLELFLWKKAQSVPCRCLCDLRLLPNNCPNNISHFLSFFQSLSCVFDFSVQKTVFIHNKGITIWRLSLCLIYKTMKVSFISVFCVYVQRTHTQTRNMSRGGGAKYFEQLGHMSALQSDL